MKIRRKNFDAITFEVVRNALDSLADEMALILMRSAYSPVVRDSMDYSTALCDRDGNMVSQGLTTALHLGSFPDAMKVIIETFKDKIYPGDVFISNDPYGGGGMHLPDIYVVKPIFNGQIIEGFATTLVHHTDIGGLTPGGTAVHATEIFQEGLCIPLLKLYENGVPNEIVFQFVGKNVRVPKKVLGDLRAQVSACNGAERGLLRLIARYGADTVHAYIGDMHKLAESRMREEILKIPDGIYDFTDYIDGLGESPTKIVFKVKVTITGDRAIVDWGGTSPQVKAAINAPGPFIRSATYLAFRCLIGPGMPNTVGYMRPITVIAPLGTIVNPTHPAACNARGIVGFRALDTLLGALAKAIPGRIPAAGEGGATNPSIGGLEKGQAFVFTETVLGSWGGRPDRDGIDGAANLAANQSNQPIEMIEAENPLQIIRYGLVQNSGGPGQYRGGLAIEREYQLNANEAVFTIRSDRRACPPYGLAGGLCGTPSYNVLHRNQTATILPALPLEKTDLLKGDRIHHIQPGAGGYGDPLLREPEKVLQDVLEEKLTSIYASTVYGVVVVRGKLNLVETIRLRKQMKAKSRAKSGTTHIEHFLDVAKIHLSK